MGANIGSNNNVNYSCDWERGCDEVTENFRYSNIQTEADQQARTSGWYISMSNSKCYCPNHSPYNNP